MGVPDESECFNDGDPCGAVSSVNGETGVVVLDAGDVGAVPVESVGLLPGETNRGTWDVAATYAVGDVVYETGSDLYIATAPSTGDQPSLTPGSWDVLDPTGRRIHLGPGATSGDFGTAVGLSATSGDLGTSVGPAATAGDFGTSVGNGATAGDFGTSVGPAATAGDYGTAVGPGATAGDYEVNVTNTYRATLDPGDPATPLTATIATGHVDLPETADVTNPPADHQRLVARTDGLYVRDQTGTEVGPLGAGGSASHPSLYRDATRYQLLGLANPRQGSSGELFTATAGSAFWWLIMPMEAIGVTGAEVYCQTGGAAGAKARLWLYPVTAGVPSGAPLIDSGDMDVTASGYKAPTWSRVNLSAHTLYAAAIITNDSAVQFRHWQGAATSDVGIPLGGSGSGSRAHSLRSIAVGYGAPPGTAPAVGIAGDHPPACFWIVAR